MKVVSPGAWSVSINLTDMYFYVPIHPEHQHFLRNVVSQTEVYQFQALPFCLSSAPQIFTMVLGRWHNLFIIAESSSAFTLMTGLSVIVIQLSWSSI